MTARHRSLSDLPAIPPMQREPRRGIRFESRQHRTIEWEDTQGQAHKSEGTTRVVGAYGCKLTMAQGLPLGQRISIVDAARKTSVVGTVVWKGKESSHGCEMGVELATPNMDVWVKEPQLAPSEERRRGQRAVLRVPVVLHFHPRNLAPQTFQVQTMTVNDHGAMVLCHRDFVPGTELELEYRQAGKRVGCKVKRQPKETPEGYQVSLEFQEPVVGFWPVNFPPPQ